MREIKFRGKRVDNGEWVYGLPVNYCNKTYILVLTDFEEERVYEQYPHKEMWPYEVIPETVGQYTGLKDKNDKEIYEGDIVPADEYYFYDATGIIKWCKDTARFIIDFDNKCIVWDFDDTHSCELEVVGNIFDNPELLESEE